MAITVDAARWPLVVARYGVEISASDILRLYEEWQRLLDRGPHAVLIDIRATNPLVMPATLRKLAAEEVEKRRAAFESSLVAEARCLNGVLMRNVVTAFDWMVGSTFSRPLRNFSDYDEAERWVRSEMGKKGLLPRAELRAE